ncbi:MULTISPECIES: OmpA family protein [unclassified Roseovarius]|uniref:OmpA family protein n=1 Tax=unclassified Roseovarius TaxID=2614913 RepID=UPI00273ECBA7|nr:MULTISPECIES: OmpA family protein [unclassified Roseovarius]
MRLSAIFAIAASFVVAAVLCLVAAGFSVRVIEDNSRNSVRDTLDANGLVWSEVDANGLQVFLGGTAPSEALRFKALSVAATVVDAARVIDQMDVADSAEIAPPDFSIEILRNDSGLSLIGLIPTSTDRADLLDDIIDATDDTEVADLLEAADYPQPETWEAAIDFAVRALKILPRTKISIAADKVEITAMADSIDQKNKIESDLIRKSPDDIRLALNISAPRPVITPFTLRFLIQDGQARFDACSADTEAARQVILKAATSAGLRQESDCTIGLGVPSPQWGKATSQAIAALAELGGGSVTFSDADISLVAEQGTPENRFDDVVGALETSLPEVFALHAVLPPPPNEAPEITPEFVATLSPEGLVQIRGRVGSETSRDTVNSFAKARFTSDSVHNTARVAAGLPQDWPLRILTGLEALSYLSNGAVTVTPEALELSGNSGNKNAQAMIARFLATKLGEAEEFSIDVVYRKALDPVASIPTPDECEAAIAGILSERKINFEPGSATIDENGAAIMDDIAEILKKCGEIRMEIGGHTDSQGREVMNQQLSQSRARAVLSELRDRRVLTSALTAKGYGESTPIADNKTEDGREANRRIEFKLIRPEPIVERQTGLESMEEANQTDEPIQEETSDEQN